MAAIVIRLEAIASKPSRPRPPRGGGGAPA